MAVSTSDRVPFGSYRSDHFVMDPRVKPEDLCGNRPAHPLPRRFSPQAAGDGPQGGGASCVLKQRFLDLVDGMVGERLGDFADYTLLDLLVHFLAQLAEH